MELDIGTRILQASWKEAVTDLSTVCVVDARLGEAMLDKNEQLMKAWCANPESHKSFAGFYAWREKQPPPKKYDDQTRREWLQASGLGDPNA